MRDAGLTVSILPVDRQALGGKAIEGYLLRRERVGADAGLEIRVGGGRVGRYAIEEDDRSFL